MPRTAVPEATVDEHREATDREHEVGAHLEPFAAGGATDLLARRLQPVLEPRGHKLVVENLTGGGSMVGMSRLAQSRPDGRTLGMGSSGLIGQIVANEIPLRFEQFTPLVRVAVDPLVIVTGGGSRIARFQDSIGGE